MKDRKDNAEESHDDKHKKYVETNANWLKNSIVKPVSTRAFFKGLGYFILVVFAFMAVLYFLTNPV